MDIERVREYFNDASTVDYYAKAVANVGLWDSEEILFEHYIKRSDRILDLGCGAGRVAMGLAQSGYLDVVGADLAEGMIEEAREIAAFLDLDVTFRREDATDLSSAEASFDAVVFAFNGLMQIPGRSNRLQAMREVRRVLEPGGVFVFTCLDRDSLMYRKVFADEGNFEHAVGVNPDLVDYGDRHFETEHGTTFMHVPNREEVLTMVNEAGFELIEDRMRSSLSLESEAVRDFAEDCRFWVLRK
tara:strand:+ start:24 stop:755 length:732 start_codon:yes stop_codon:yes gene_type:complete